jgi:hypothetical protein
VITAAAVCPAPPLLARELTGADPVVPELRQACLDAVAELARSAPDVVAVVGAGERTREFGSHGRLDLAAYAPALAHGGLHGSGADGESSLNGSGDSLPLSLGLGRMLLRQAGYGGALALQSVHDQASAADCAAIGARIAGSATRVALLVMADGSARRGLKAPGYLDERSFPFDAQVTDAIREGDMAALLALDAGLARDLMATGRPAWQVLAGALSGPRPAAVIRYCDDPFGVAYLVASLSPQHDAVSTSGRERG